uniref:Uncharacterized protein n=1 Tax=Glossina morsitans morsitans TaxID=37546 RepID=A0A1B0G078_GLOMM
MLQRYTTKKINLLLATFETSNILALEILALSCIAMKNTLFHYKFYLKSKKNIVRKIIMNFIHYNILSDYDSYNAICIILRKKIPYATMFLYYRICLLSEMK